MPDSRPEPYEKQVVPSKDSLAEWHKVVKDPLFLQVLQGYRFKQVERLLEADSDKEIGAIKGVVRFIDNITSGGLDNDAKGVLGLDTTGPPPGTTEYMRFDTDQQEKK